MTSSSAPTDLQVIGLGRQRPRRPRSGPSCGSLKSTLPDADVTLREHRLSWRRDPTQPSLTVFGALVTRQVGPFTLRREFAVPER